MLKKNICLEIVLIPSFYYTTDVYPYPPTYRASIYMHLFLFVAICENPLFLWKSFWILFTRENLFFLWKFFLCLRNFSFSMKTLFESFLSVRICSFYPWESLLFVKIFFYLWECLLLFSFLRIYVLIEISKRMNAII